MASYFLRFSSSSRQNKLRTPAEAGGNLFFTTTSISRSLIGRELWEMRVHTTARVMNACDRLSVDLQRVKVDFFFCCWGKHLLT